MQQQGSMWLLSTISKGQPYWPISCTFARRSEVLQNDHHTRKVCLSFTARAHKTCRYISTKPSNHVTFGPLTLRLCNQNSQVAREPFRNGQSTCSTWQCVKHPRWSCQRLAGSARRTCSKGREIHLLFRVQVSHCASGRSTVLTMNLEGRLQI